MSSGTARVDGIDGCSCWETKVEGGADVDCDSGDGRLELGAVVVTAGGVDATRSPRAGDTVSSMRLPSPFRTASVGGWDALEGGAGGCDGLTGVVVGEAEPDSFNLLGVVSPSEGESALTVTGSCRAVGSGV